MAKKKTLSEKGIILSFLLPSFIGFCIFILLPMIMAFVLSFTNYSGGPSYKMIGLKNYIVAFSNSSFIQSLGLTFKYMLITVILQIVLGLLFAILLSKEFSGCSAFRSIYYIPNILSSVAVGLSFMFIFEPSSGLMNQLFMSIGLEPSKWLAGSKDALNVIITVSVWQNFGYYMVLFIGGLQNIPRTLYEASEMDGANFFQKFIHVTIPGLSPILFYGITIAVIRGFQAFDYIYVMTGGQQGGGPAGSTNLIAFDIYINSFTFFRFGYASAESVILMIIILFVTYIQNKGQKRWVSYDIV
ncbi:MAG: sugar ABC transporter permease [Spirochaetaceae bacterium]|nr:sugar ABC transporter permease [Spirochaetaceae bacterium]